MESLSLISWVYKSQLSYVGPFKMLVSPYPYVGLYKMLVSPYPYVGLYPYVRPS